jgi:hypothetical protein
VTARISRTQAWCKLAVLIAEGLPAPRDIRIVAEGAMIADITVDSLSDLHAWAYALGALFDEPFVNGGRVLHEATVRSWHGYYLGLKFHDRSEAVKPESITEDLSQVREIAAAVSE